MAGDEFMQQTFNTGKTWEAPTTPCNHGWDKDKRIFWLTPRNKCVKCSKQFKKCPCGLMVEADSQHYIDHSSL